MKKAKYPLIATVGLLLWLIGTWHGGWQAEPQSSFERLTDFIGGVMLFWGVIGDISTGITYNKHIDLKADAVHIHTHGDDKDSDL